MPGKYAKVEMLNEEVYRRKAAGETNRESGFEISSSPIIDVIREALQQEKAADELTLHSDQGSQYTSILQPDSRIPHPAVDVRSRMPLRQRGDGKLFLNVENGVPVPRQFSSRAEVEQLAAEYIHFYNLERISLNNGLTSFEILGKAV